MSNLIPSNEERIAFFDSAVLAPFQASRTIRSFAGEDEDVKDEVVEEDGGKLLVGDDKPVTLAFADNLDGDIAQAARDSITYAERYADGNANKAETPMRWHAKYATAMKYCGWSTTGYKYASHTVKQKNITMESIVLDIIGAVAGANKSAMLKLLGDAFGTIKSDDGLTTLFDKNSKSGKEADFRIVPCLSSAKGTAITALLAMDCELKTEQGGAWFWKWNMSEVKMKKAAAMIELNMDEHERARDWILEALGANSEAFFKSAKLASYDDSDS